MANTVVRSRLIAITLLASLATAPAFAQQKAFPQAEGFGAVAQGGRGGDVYHVTTLDDSGAPGSLRHAIDTAPTTGRTIVFEVGGWIELGSQLGIVNGKRNITIAGQTAPGGGIGVRGHQFSIGGDDIVIRHMRFRPGRGPGRVDALGANSDAERIMLDHVSAGFAYDENFSTQAQDLTLQYSSVSYGLVDHSAGSLIEQAYRLSFHHNLYAHNHTRNPKARVNETIDWLDNVIYDYNNGFIAGDSDTTTYFWTANLDGNYYITGPGDTGRPMVKDGRAWNYGLYFGTNAYDNDGDTTHDGVPFTGNGLNGDGLENVVTGTYTWSPSRYPTPPIWQNANTEQAYQRVLTEFGATPWNRDEVDQLLHHNVVNRTGDLIERESDLVGISDGGFGTLAGGVAPVDTDRDGIPDSWERKHRTLVEIPNNNDDFDFDGYTDLEEYLNDLAAFKAPGPVEFEASVGRYAEWQNWARDWEPSRLDDVHINSGQAIVDVVGQRAGNLRLLPTTGENALLSINIGWLEVSNELEIGRNAGNAFVWLQGGELFAETLRKGAAGMFVFSQGTLHTDHVLFDLTNVGGTLEPGSQFDGTGITTIAGNYQQMEGSTLAVDLTGTTAGTEHDQLTVTGVATLGGRLEILSGDDYTEPAQRGTSDEYALLIASGIVGTFDEVTFNGETLASAAHYAGLGEGELDGLFRQLAINDTNVTLTNYLALPGDANGDGTVDGPDFVAWNDHKFTSGTNWTTGDFNGDGITDGQDFVIWNDHKFTSVDLANVPAPATPLWCLLGLACYAAAPRLRCRGR